MTENERNMQNHADLPPAGENDRLDGVESALLDLAAAEAAGVFARSKVPADILHRGHRQRFLRIWAGPLAAAVVLAFAVGSYFFQQEIALVRVARASNAWNPLSRCMMPEGRSDLEVCRQNDGDGDGDFDLADFSQFQLAYGSNQ